MKLIDNLPNQLKDTKVSQTKKKKKTKKTI